MENPRTGLFLTNSSFRRGRARLALAVLLVASLPVYPATITVNDSTSSLTAGDGMCSLREAINNANSDSDTTLGDCAAGGLADTIELITDVDLTLADNGLNGLPEITSKMVIDGNGNDRLLQADHPRRAELPLHDQLPDPGLGHSSGNGVSWRAT